MKNIRKICGAAIILSLVGYIICMTKKYKSKIAEISKDREKLGKLYCFENQWLNAKISKNEVSDYLSDNNYKNIAIYGMAKLGQTLVNDLENSPISIKFGIDRDAEVYWNTFPIITPDEVAKYDFSEVDVVIVTAISFFEEIRTQLSKELECPIISLEDII